MLMPAEPELSLHLSCQRTTTLPLSPPLPFASSPPLVADPSRREKKTITHLDQPSVPGEHTREPLGCISSPNDGERRRGEGGRKEGEMGLVEGAPVPKLYKREMTLIDPRIEESQYSTRETSRLLQRARSKRKRDSTLEGSSLL